MRHSPPVAPSSSRVARRRRLAALCLLGVLPLPACMSPVRFGGPIPVRNQHPAQLTVLRLEPTSAETLAQGASRADVSMAYSSLFLLGGSARDTFIMDGEILRTQLGGRYGLTDTVQVDFVIPVAHTSGGFLDRTVDDWHDWFDTPESGRDRVRNNRFLVNATRDGETVYSMDAASLALMDLPIGVTWRVHEAREALPVAVALRGAIELPTGDANDGFGNGGVDVALGVVGEMHLGPVGVTAHLAYTFAHTPDRARDRGVEFGDVLSWGVGIEGALTGHTAAVIQVEGDDSVLRQLDAHTDGHQVMLWVGLRTWLDASTALELSFGEDLTRNLPPDFTGYIGLRADFAP